MSNVIAGGGGGILLQTIEMAVAKATGTDFFPNDDTTPLVSEGAQIGTQAITLKSTSSKVLIIASIQTRNATINRGVVLALFRGSTCIGVAMYRTISADQDNGPLPLMVLDEPATSGEVTYSLRAGVNESGGGTYFINDTSESDDFGGVMLPGAILQEFSE